MPAAIVVSYRRATTSNAAGRLADRLMDRFGEDQVFVDVDAIDPGVDWVDVIENAVAACKVLLVVIGPTWHAVVDAAGRRRLDDPQDPVVLEVTAGLATPGIGVIPVLVDGAQMPRVDDLPPALRRLARINAARLEYATFRRDATQLMEVLERVLAASPATPPSRPPLRPPPSTPTDPGPQWFDAAARDSAARRAGPAHHGWTIPAAAELSPPVDPAMGEEPVEVDEYRVSGRQGGRRRVVQCPRCADFDLDVRDDGHGFAFHCRACRHEWSWRPGTAWPATVVRPGLARTPPPEIA